MRAGDGGQIAFVQQVPAGRDTGLGKAPLPSANLSRRQCRVLARMNGLTAGCLENIAGIRIFTRFRTSAIGGVPTLWRPSELMPFIRSYFTSGDDDCGESRNRQD